MYYSFEWGKFAHYLYHMRKYTLFALIMACSVLSSCGEYNKILKSTDADYQYEAAKSFFGQGKYSKAATLLESLVTVMKGSDRAEESLYMLGMTYYNQADYQTASHYFNTYYTTYPHGVYTEQARYHSGKALYLDTPEPRLDQSGTYKAIQELQLFLEYFPSSSYHAEVQQLIFELQDKLVIKDYMAAKLYYDLGMYTGNATYTTTGNNYLAAIVTAQNALRDYPYTKLREDLSVLVLRAKHDMANASILEKKPERMRDVIDEYYSFVNEFPESKYKKEVEGIYHDASKYVDNLNDEE
ncbi:outer membrane assembly lipoprotein YfiO [Bacteroidetes bacterium oral taxon 272 str. F0290]|nr:outer membrane assembly lipoprotein YfiO [Bacteroidetes bacterium oral taxon 272 str. F0290]